MEYDNKEYYRLDGQFPRPEMHAVLLIGEKTAGSDEVVRDLSIVGLRVQVCERDVWRRVVREAEGHSGLYCSAVCAIVGLVGLPALIHEH